MTEINVSDLIAELNNSVIYSSDGVVTDSEILSQVFSDDGIFLLVLSESELGSRDPVDVLNGVFNYRGFGEGSFSDSHLPTIILAVRGEVDTDLYYQSEYKTVPHNLLIELGWETDQDIGVYLFNNIEEINEVITEVKLPTFESIVKEYEWKNAIESVEEAREFNTVELSEPVSNGIESSLALLIAAIVTFFKFLF